MAKRKKIHPKIKQTLGFDESISDKDFLKAWKIKSTQVCKPCWELKYCPYGPFVEQSPVLPSVRESAIEHNEYLKTCLSTNTTGGVRNLSPEEIERKKETLEMCKQYPFIILPEVFRDINYELEIKEGIEKGLGLFELYQTPYKDFEKYQVPFPLDKDELEQAREEFDEIRKIKITPELKKRIKQKLDKLKNEIKTGIEDYRKPLDPLRKKYFEESVRDFKPENYPEYIPNEVADLACNIFGPT